jgi:hypothetical protein
MGSNIKIILLKRNMGVNLRKVQSLLDYLLCFCLKYAKHMRELKFGERMD